MRKVIWNILYFLAPAIFRASGVFIGLMLISAIACQIWNLLYYVGAVVVILVIYGALFVILAPKDEEGE